MDNIESTTNIITNKIMKVSGEDKRVVQLEVALGLKRKQLSYKGNGTSNENTNYK